MIRTDPGFRSLGSDPGIRFRDPRLCLLLSTDMYMNFSRNQTVKHLQFCASEQESLPLSQSRQFVIYTPPSCIPKQNTLSLYLLTGQPLEVENMSITYNRIKYPVV